MPWEHDAGTRCEHVEAFAEVRAQAFKPEQRQPRRRKFYCQRNPVQALAYLDDRRHMGGRQREVWIGLLCARDEEFDGTGTRRNGQLIVDRYRKPADAINVLFRNLERFLAGGKEAHLRRCGARRVDELGDEMDQMLAIVEHQQQSLRREQRRNAGRGRLVAGEWHTQRAGHGRRNESAVAQ